MSLRKGALCAVLTLGAFSLAGCTVSPVHTQAQAGPQERLDLRYGAPSNRLQQVFYQALSARTGTPSADAPELTIAISSAVSRIGLANIASPVTDYQVTMRGTYTVRQGDTVLATGTRAVSSGFTIPGQVLANDAARAQAEEEAARALADAVRLALYAELGGQ